MAIRHIGYLVIVLIALFLLWWFFLRNKGDPFGAVMSPKPGFTRATGRAPKEKPQRSGSRGGGGGRSGGGSSGKPSADLKSRFPAGGPEPLTKGYKPKPQPKAAAGCGTWDLACKFKEIFALRPSGLSELMAGKPIGQAIETTIRGGIRR